MLDRDTWLKEADAAAARAYGEKHSTMFALRHGAGLIGILAGVAALGAGAFWIWRHVSPPSLPAAHAGIPAAFWAVLAVIVVGTVVLFRTVAAPTLFFLKLAVAGVVWLGLAGYLVAVTI